MKKKGIRGFPFNCDDLNFLSFVFMISANFVLFYVFSMFVAFHEPCSVRSKSVDQVRTDVDSDAPEMIYGSPEAERYFQTAMSDVVTIDVDDLSARSQLVVRPLSAPDNFPPVTCRTQMSVELEPEDDDLYTAEEDLANKAHAARVASVLNDAHRPSAGESPLDERADRMAEAILASALFESVFLQPELKSPFIGASFCRVRIQQPEGIQRREWAFAWRRGKIQIL